MYEDDFADPMARYKEITQQTTKSNPETMGRFHTNWLNMMYPRLRLAANLLRDDGVIFISIDDNEVVNLRKLCDEVFGEENFVATLVYDKNRKNDAKYFSVGHEYMLVYFKSAATISDLGIVLRASKTGIDEVKTEFNRLRKEYGDNWDKVNAGLKNLYSSWDKNDERKPLARFTKVDEYGPYRDDGNISWPGGGGPHYEVIHPVTKKPCKIPDAGWRFPSQKRMQEEIDAGSVVFGIDETTLPRIRRNLFESDKQVMRSVFFSYAQTATVEFNKIFNNVRVFENPKNPDDIRKLIEYVTEKDDNDIILDFFSGSATTAHAVMQLNAEDGGNRKFIMVQLPELCDEKSEAYKAGYKNICEIGKERIRRAGKKILDSVECKNVECRNKEEICEANFNNNSTLYTLHSTLDTGFKVFKLDTSNLKIWDDTVTTDGNSYITVDELTERINSMTKSIKSDRTDMDVVYEIMLKMGIPLDVPVQYTEINGNIVYIVGDFLLMIALYDNITAEDIEEIAKYAPGKIICAEQHFTDNSPLSNAYYILRDKQIELKLV